jgi:hypothetical protein
MQQRILVGTRKGLFALTHDASAGDSTWSTECLGFLGDPVSAVLADPRDGALYAALELGHFGVKLHRSDDGGRTWNEIDHPRFDGEKHPTPETWDEPIDYDGPTVSAIWALESAGIDRPGGLWAGTVSGGLFHSNDRGRTWTLNDPFWQEFAPASRHWPPPAGKPAIHTVVVDPRDSDRMLVGTTSGIWRSIDGGSSWSVSGPGMHMDMMPPEISHLPDQQDPHRIVACAAAPDVLWVQHHCGVFHSSDWAESWQEITAIRPSKFGFAVVVHPRDPARAWFVPGVKDECRLPVDAKLVVARTSDAGASFDVLRDGLPQEHAYDLVLRHAMDIDASGDVLAFGSTTGNLFASVDGGDHWRQLSGNLPPIYCVRFG